MMFEEYQDRVGELITGIIQQSDSRYTLVQLRERVEALLPKSEQVDSERYDHGMRVKAVITEVSSSTKGPSIIVSRRSPELIKKLFELEVPEVADGLVEIVNVAREPGYRSKIAVVSHADGVDPVGACVGPARLAGAHGRVRAARREDRHHPPQRRARPVRRQGAVAGARARGARRRREQAGDRRGARRPALAGDRQGGPERPPRRAADRLARRHQVRDRVRRGGGGAAATSQEEDVTGRCHAVLEHRQALPERGAAGLALLRPARAPGARGPGGRPRRRRRRSRGAGRAEEPRRRGASRRGAAPRRAAVAEEPVAEQSRWPRSRSPRGARRPRSRSPRSPSTEHRRAAAGAAAPAGADEER